MNRYKLATQINIIFSFVTILGGIIFLFVLNLSFSRGYENQNAIYLSNYYEKVKTELDINNANFTFDYETVYNDYLIISEGTVFAYSENNISEERRNRVRDTIIADYFNTTPSNDKINFTRFGNISYMGEIFEEVGEPKYALIVISDTAMFVTDMTGNIPFYTTLAFINILVLGNIIIWLWSSNTVKNLRELRSKVDKMVENNYQKEIKSDSAEEIRFLASAIDDMRIEIKDNEETKKDMIQNLGHDLKTPIAVIKSYAEAMIDGIEDMNSAAFLIIKQADNLNNKVKQIIDYSKVGYIKLEENFEEISMKEVITQVVNHYKYLTQAKFIIDIDHDWKHMMLKDNFYTAISNIVDNAVRYATSKIVIQLTDKKLTIFNDGEHIEEDVLPKLFKAYEKGSKGQFGLGMAIAKETLDHFKLKINVCNHHNGVLFTIEPQ